MYVHVENLREKIYRKTGRERKRARHRMKERESMCSALYSGLRLKYPPGIIGTFHIRPKNSSVLHTLNKHYFSLSLK